MKTIIIGLLITLVLASLPAPNIMLQNPKLLYAAAMYKTAVGDTDSALRLIGRAEQAQQRTRAAHAQNLQAAGECSAILTVL